MNQEIAWSANRDEAQAVQELSRQIKGERSNCRLVMFFASVSYNFEQLSSLIKQQFPNSEVVGCSTSGEISAKGFTKNGIVLTTMSCSQTKVKGVLIREAGKFPMIYKEDVLSAMKACGISAGPGSSHKDSFAITFINGLCNAEECILSLLYSIVGDDAFQVLGGSAGDDLKFQQTYVSLNGEVVSDGGVVVFVRSPKKFVIQKENIFHPTGRKVALTKVDIENRKLIQINGRPAASEYAKVVGVSEAKISDATLMNPLGRMFGDNIFISSIASVNPDKSFGMYCRVMPNTTVDVMELADVKKQMDNTCDDVLSQIPKPGFVFFINCILRTLAFDNSDDGSYLVKLYNNRFGKVCGFSSYGEQINKVNSNQTLVLLAMEE